MVKRYRTYSIEFKKQVAQEFAAGETLHALARRYELSANLVRQWASKYEQGALDGGAQARAVVRDYEVRIAALERLVGRQALELEFLKGALKRARRPRSETTSVITGPLASPSPKDAD